jgi:hypothetical protein
MGRLPPGGIGAVLPGLPSSVETRGGMISITLTLELRSWWRNESVHA